MRNLKKSKTNFSKYTKDVQLPNAEIEKILKNEYCQKLMRTS